MSATKTLPVLLFGALLAACGGAPTDPGSGTTNQDQTEVSSELAANPQYIDDDVYASEDPTSASLEATGGVALESAQELVHPLTFWRRITNVRSGFEFAFSDTDSTGRPTLGVVTIHRSLTGTFNIAAGVPGTEGRVIHKPLHDLWTRRVMVKRVSLPGSARREWRVIATSGVQVVSDPSGTDLIGLRVQAGAVDTTISDPLAFFHLRRMLRFSAEDSVTLTATTLHSDDVVFLQHRDHRFRLRPNGDNTYTGTFRVGVITGVHYAGVNALSHGTLFDDAAAYSSEAWIFPFVTTPIELAFGDD